jgi:predicted metal-dependent phosphoesterase TrpH
VAARIVAPPELSDPTGAMIPPDLRLTAPSSYVVLAPLYTLWDGVAMLSMSRLRGFLLGLAILFGLWRVGRVLLRRPFSPRAELRALVVSLVILGIFIAGGLLSHRPMVKLAGLPRNLAAVDFHSHSNKSHDVRGTAMARFDTRRNLQWHERAGFDAVFLTDHNTTAGLIPTNVPVALCRGREVSAWRAHIVLLGGQVDSVRGPYRRDWTGLLQLLADADTRYGSVTIASLPEYERYHQQRLDSLVQAGLDGFEIVNASPKANELTRVRRDSVIALARQHDRLVVGATDHHGWGATSMVWNLVRVPGRENLERLCASVMEALQRGFEGVSVVERHRLRPDDWWPMWLTPLAVIWETWRGMGWEMTAAWLAWIWAFWVVGRTRYLPSP